MKIYLEYCLQQNENGHPFSKTLKHIFGMNKGMDNAKKYRRLLLDTIQTNNLNPEISSFEIDGIFKMLSLVFDKWQICSSFK